VAGNYLINSQVLNPYFVFVFSDDFRNELKEKVVELGELYISDLNERSYLHPNEVEEVKLIYRNSEIPKEIRKKMWKALLRCQSRMERAQE
jgi:hypothetical protein